MINDFFSKMFTKRKEREKTFLRHIDELLSSGESSWYSEKIMLDAKKMVETRDFSFAQLYIANEFNRIRLTSGMKLSDGELKLLREVSYSKDAVWASRQHSELRNGVRVSVDAINQNLNEAKKKAERGDDKRQ